MGVRYHQVVSQDLVSLKTLSCVHDNTEPSATKTTASQHPSMVKQPMRVDMKQGRPVRNTSDLELPMSPIANPSVLEFLDTSSASESLYSEQPRVSTMKKPYLPPTHSASAMPFKHQDLPARHPLGLDSMRDLSSFPKTLYAANKPLLKPAATNKESNLFSTYANEAAKTMNKPFNKPYPQSRNASLDTERPILSVLAKSPRQDGKRPSRYSWSDIDWYNDKTSVHPPPAKKRNITADTASFHDREVGISCCS